LEQHAKISSRLEGNIVISELNCAACHASANSWLAPKGGPDLSEARARMHHFHVQRFITNPSGTKPGTTTPDVLAPLPETERQSAPPHPSRALLRLFGPRALLGIGRSLA